MGKSQVQRHNSMISKSKLLLLVIIVILLIGGGLFLISQWKKPKAAPSIIAPPIVGVKGTVQSARTKPFPTLSQNDSDKDGLPDQEEGLRGTDPKKADTDNDGMSDGEEVKGLGTDPLNSDTDGDGHNDGDEVKAGYNPMGEGKLK